MAGRYKQHKSNAEYLKAWREDNPTYTKQYMKGRREGVIGPYGPEDRVDWRERNRAEFLAAKRESTNRRRREVFEEALQRYGRCCYCCGEREPLCLGLDHIEGKGNEHRREIKMRAALWAKRNGWPPLFRVACHSCNLAAHLNGGTCPHKQAG